jgi:shikimate kinase
MSEVDDPPDVNPRRVDRRRVSSPPRRAVLVGPPGAGKSTVGRALAVHWSTSFRDTDADVEQTAGKSIADVFVEDGEPAFRRLEEDAVAAALAMPDGVVALGGGAVTSERTRVLLRDHRVVFLDVGLSAAVRRVGLGAARPLVFGNVRAQLKALLDARRAWYEQVATVTITTDDRSVENVVAAIDEALAQVGS